MTLHAATPAGECLYAIGDIHGCRDLLDNLLKTVAEDALHVVGPKTLVFLGDYIDRGPDSRGVIEFLLHKLPAGFKTIFLRGNHEDYMLKFLEGDLGAAHAWLRFGGTACLASYGINPYRPNLQDDLKSLHIELTETLPASHREFLEATAYSYTAGDYYFVHGGIRPGVSLDKQQPEDQMWIRDEFLSSTQNFGKMIVHGHSITLEPDIQLNRIGIDSGAYATGHLTCLKLRDTERQFFTT